MLKERENYYVDLIKNSKSFSEVCRKANIVATTGNYDTLKKIVEKNEINISHFKRNSGCFNKPIKTIEYLCNGSIISSYKLKNKLLKEGYKEHKCECCGRTTWNDKEIPLELHHINGNKTDNRLENLQILCPNCHAFTDNYCGKNQKNNIKERYCLVCGKKLNSGQIKYCSNECRFKKNKENIIKKQRKRKINVDKETIINDFKNIKSFSGVGRKYGVSDNAIKKYCKRNGFFDEIVKYVSQKNKNNK